MNSQKSSSGASLREEMACLDCPQTKNQPEGDVQRLPELSTISDGSTERFNHVDKSRVRALGGSGIGLTIAQSLAQAMGGEIQIESSGLDQGSSFTLTLPQAHA